MKSYATISPARTPTPNSARWSWQKHGELAQCRQLGFSNRDFDEIWTHIWYHSEIPTYWTLGAYVWRSSSLTRMQEQKRSLLHLQKETPSQGKRRADQWGRGRRWPMKEGPVWQTVPKPDPPAYWIKTLEVPYLVWPPHQGIWKQALNFLPWEYL